MSLSSPAMNETVRVTNDVDLIRTSLCRVRDAHTEVSLADLVSDNEEPVLRQERRRTARAQLQLPVVLIPVDWSLDDNETLIVCGEEQVGVTRDISPTGVGLTHDQLLGSDAVIVQFDLPDEGPLNLVLDLRWSVRKSQFSYMSGGRVVGAVTSLVRPSE